MPESETKTLQGRILKAQWIIGLPVLGPTWIGIGDGDWADKSNPPPVSAAATGLTHELARKRVHRTAYLELDDTTGTLPFRNHLYKEVAGPTPIVALYADFGPDEAVGFQVCEEGIFAGTIETTASPYAVGAEVTLPGTLYWVRNRPVQTKISGDVYLAVAIFEEK